MRFDAGRRAVGDFQTAGAIDARERASRREMPRTRARFERRKTKYESEKSREIVYLIEESECVEKMSGREGRGAAGAESKSKRSSGT
jgi:uncharacterized membrane protein